MATPNLADPDFEPDDEQLAGLMKRAFAKLPEERRQREEALRAAIAAAREEARRAATEKVPPR